MCLEPIHPGKGSHLKVRGGGGGGQCVGLHGGGGGLHGGGWGHM